MYLLDTDILIDIQRGHTPAIAWFASLSEIPSIPGFVAMELIQDAQNKQKVRKALQVAILHWGTHPVIIEKKRNI